LATNDVACIGDKRTLPEEQERLTKAAQIGDVLADRWR
jgi:hypothetical protein